MLLLVYAQRENVSVPLRWPYSGIRSYCNKKLCESAHVAEQTSPWHGLLRCAATSIRSAERRTGANEMAVFPNWQMFATSVLGDEGLLQESHLGGMVV